MARYYLDIVVGTQRIPDQDGYEWPDAEVARDRALQEIRSLLSDRMVSLLDARDCHVEVSDQAHRFLFKVDLSEAYGSKPEQ